MSVKQENKKNEKLMNCTMNTNGYDSPLPFAATENPYDDICCGCMIISTVDLPNASNVPVLTDYDRQISTVVKSKPIPNPLR